MCSDYHFDCGTCGKVFEKGWRARDDHLRSTGHSAPEYECDTCARYFGSERARFQHMEALNHFHLECSICDETWPSDEQRTEHEHLVHNYCRVCGRTFRNFNCLKMHLNSRTHRGKHIQCPFCKNNFVTATGLTHHLEMGSCPNAEDVDRDSLYKFVRGKDPNHIITKKLIDWHESPRYEATERSYNPERGGWECYFCHRVFMSLWSLNMHLSSPVHQRNLYHCPNRACRKDFKTLAGIINHLESESCGCTRFEKVQRSIQDVVSGDKLIPFK